LRDISAYLLVSRSPDLSAGRARLLSPYAASQPDGTRPALTVTHTEPGRFTGATVRGPIATEPVVTRLVERRRD
jgi:hypothetical protein